MIYEAAFDAKFGKGIKILTPKQMLQRLPIALAQVKARNTSENVLNEIHQMIYLLYQAKEMTKKVCNNTINSIKLSNGMNTTFMNSENSKTSDPDRLCLSIWDKRDVKRSEKLIHLSNLRM